MSKLFKLKEWLTVEEASKHLTTMLGEEVSIADIFRLALDKHLVLSMNFPNGTYGNFGKVVSLENTRRFTPPADLMESMRKVKPESGSEEIIISDYIGDGQFINWEEKVVAIDGVWDLAMLASERIDVEYDYHKLIGGPKIDLVGLNGAFVNQGEVFCRLVESFDDNENQSGSTAARKQIESFLSLNEVSAVRKNEIWERYENDRKEYLVNKKDAPFERDFFPAGGLPSDGVYVVRTAEIVDFLNRINEAPKQEKPLSTKERNSMFTLIAALAKEANFDLQQRGIASALAASTETLGKPLSDDTIRTILKQVNDLLS
jgi:hypothetical protein